MCFLYYKSSIRNSIYVPHIFKHLYCSYPVGTVNIFGSTMIIVVYTSLSYSTTYDLYKHEYLYKFMLWFYLPNVIIKKMVLQWLWLYCTVYMCMILWGIFMFNYFSIYRKLIPQLYFSYTVVNLKNLWAVFTFKCVHKSDKILYS